jgi:hypothetical protein
LDTTQKLTVETVAVDRLFCSPANPRRNDPAVPYVAASIRRFGFRQPIVARPSGEVIAGNTRLKAALSLGLTEVPVAWFDGSDFDATAYAIADNRTARIADLRAEIDRIKAREAQRKVTKDPSLRHISAAVHALDKATAATQDKATRVALTEARATLAACLALNGVKLGGGGGGVRRRSGGVAPEPENVLAYLEKHPGSRSEEICAEFGTDTATLRQVLHRLRDEGKIKVQGKARATRYTTTS